MKIKNFLQLIFCTFLCLLITQSFAQKRFQFPLYGTYGKDYIIVNYVDWGIGASFKDNYCLDKSYNGHQGTDLVIQDFSAMDSGVNVLAVDSGLVIFVKDGVFDREKVSDTLKGLGNYVGISHSGKVQTYYAHLKKNSILVSKGDVVLPGQKLGQVASSGNSSSPHLHFELWYDSLYPIDPFSGPCGNTNSYWKNEPAFDSIFNIWENGILNFKPNLDTLKEGLASIDTIYKVDSSVATWTLMYGLRKNDSLTTKWYTPAGNLWFQYSNSLTKNWWYYYYWNYIQTALFTEEGKWKVTLSRNGREVQSQNFYYYHKKNNSSKDTTLTNKEFEPTNLLMETHDNLWVVSGLKSNTELKIWSQNGQEIDSFKEKDNQIIVNRKRYPNGVYFLVLDTGEKPIIYKVYN
tara:strand:- start:321 stop:1535 length:1215 start_codon:yes stop_codon:yes gene_type:complete